MASKIIVDQLEKTGGALTALTLPTGNASASQYLQNDGSGNLSWATVTSGTNTPAWHVGINSATQTIPDATTTIVELDDVKFDTGFTWDTVNYKGVPGTAGKYLIGVYADFDPTSQGYMWVYLFKNTTSIAFFGSEDLHGVQQLNSFGGTTIVDLNDTDYVQMKVYIDYPSGTATIRQYDATQCVTYMFGTKLIGA